MCMAEQVKPMTDHIESGLTFVRAMKNSYNPHCSSLGKKWRVGSLSYMPLWKGNGPEWRHRSIVSQPAQTGTSTLDHTTKGEFWEAYCVQWERAHTTSARIHLWIMNWHTLRVFESNGYPSVFVRWVLDQPPTRNNGSADKIEEEESKPQVLYLPYVQGVSEKIECGCRNLGVRTVFKSRHTFRQTLINVKSRTPKECKRGAVYEIPCWLWQSTMGRQDAASRTG